MLDAKSKSKLNLLGKPGWVYQILTHACGTVHRSYGSLTSRRREGLMNAYRGLLNKLEAATEDTVTEDLISVYLHHTDTAVRGELSSLDSTEHHDLPPRWGGNNPHAAMAEAERLLAKTPAGHRPVFVFMSDGGDCKDGPIQDGDYEAKMTQIYNQHKDKGLRTYVVAFGRDAEADKLTQLAQISAGEILQSADAATLLKQFETIADDVHPLSTKTKPADEALAVLDAEGKLVGVSEEDKKAIIEIIETRSIQAAEGVLKRNRIRRTEAA